MSLRSVLGLAAVCLIAGSAFAQTPPPPSQPRAVTRTMYTRNTELFVERFVFDDVAVYANVQAALAAESPEEPRLVKTRRTFGDAIEITSGLRAGDRIVIRGADKIPRQ